MDDAPLHLAAGIDCPNGFHEALQAVHAEQIHIPNPLAFEIVLDSVYTRSWNCDRMEISKKTGERKMDASYHRHDINEKVRELLEPHLPGQRGQWGGIAQDNRRFINAVF